MENLVPGGGGGNVLGRSNNVFACANTFNSDIVRWRQLAAKLWSALFIFVLVLVHSVTAECDGLFKYNIASMLLGLLTHLFHLRFWLNSILIGILFWILNSFNDKLFTVTPKVFANNIEKLIQLVYSLNSVCILVNVAFTFVISWSLLQFYDSARINVFYVMMFCVMSNFVSKFWFVFNGNYLLKWPIIEQTKYLRFKARVYNIALDSFKRVVLHLFSWQIIFFLIGSFIYNICSILSIGQKVELGDDDETASVRYTTSANLFTILVAVKLAFMINFVHMVSWNLYEIYLTEIYHFEIQPIDKSQLSLPSAMSLNQSAQISNQRYIQTLAMIEFANMSANCKMKRLQLFCLNYKNGQPINWTSVSTEALNIIKGFIDIFSFDDMLHGTNAERSSATSTFDSGLASSRPSSKRLSNLTSPIRSGISSNHLGVQSEYESNFATSATPTSPGDRLRSPRSPYYVTSPSKIQSKNSNPSLAFAYTNQVFQKIIGMLKKQKLFSYIYNENVNYKNQQLIVDSFLVINALKGLANLAKYSIEEDQYGIVQQTLADILSTFMNLQKTIEKYHPICCPGGGLSFKVLQNPNANKIDLLLQKLYFVLNESTYKITMTFGTSLKSLNLPEEVAKRLQRYQLTQ